MAKKKFKDTKVGQFLLNNNSGIVNTIGDVLPSKGILGIVKGLIDKDKVLPPEDKEKALKLLEMDMVEMQEVTKRWEADLNSDNKLSKNVRPLTLIFFSVAYVVGWYLDYSLENITGLLSLIVGAYFGGRSYEKTRK
tara:strand:+ start:686 stop:1096 length:411 start_codon:yes stop_codon:yes gene_type:complete